MNPWLLAEIAAVIAVGVSAGWLAWPYLARRYNAAQMRIFAAVGLLLLVFIVFSLLPPLPMEADVAVVIVATAGLMSISLWRLRRPGGITDTERSARRAGIVIQAAALVLGLVMLVLLMAQNGA